jgi:hypothetical protein
MGLAALSHIRAGYLWFSTHITLRGSALELNENCILQHISVSFMYHDDDMCTGVEPYCSRAETARLCDASRHCSLVSQCEPSLSVEKYGYCAVCPPYGAIHIPSLFSFALITFPTGLGLRLAMLLQTGLLLCAPTKVRPLSIEVGSGVT